VGVTLQMATGQIATIECNADSGYGYEVEVDVRCERGTVSTVNEPGPHLTPGWLERFADAYRVEMAAWAEAAAAGEATGPSALDGAMAQAVIDACIQSAVQGIPIEVVASSGEGGTG
jgi:myo-inositol 2-dehydrogenase/D-chiro-inositol 1-dehydrogenase